MTSKVTSVNLKRLAPHPDNPNRMSKSTFAKLVRNIERTGRYEPLIVRPAEPQGTSHESRKKARRAFFQIINGHHRFEALKQLGYERCDCVIWDVDDNEAHLLLATLNRLCGSDVLEKKLALLKKLSAERPAKELAKLTPYAGPQIQRLLSLLHRTVPKQLAEAKAECFALPMVFFLDSKQKATIEKALSVARPDDEKLTGAQKNAKALTEIAMLYVRQLEGNQG